MTNTSPTHAHDVDLRELIDLALDPAPDHALVALTAAAQVTRRLADLRWPTAVAALHHGAGPAAIAAALGDDDVEWITVALAAWADQQLHDGHLDHTDHDRLTARLGRPTTATT